MNQHIAFARSQSVFGRRLQPTGSRIESLHSEDIHIRNYDHYWSYDLAIEIIHPDGGVMLNKRYFLQPEGIESVVDAVPDGKYEVRVSLDGDEGRAIECRITEAPENTVVIEVGNGTFSLTHGLRP